jgi:UDP-2,3-diacylglucosamine hydrolase
MIIITDAHINKARGNHTAFFKMLAAIERTEHDLILLGDIFDLWVALPRYEEDLHIKFIAWCLEQKDRRTIGYLEGNHDFFLASQRAEAFTWCSKCAWRQDDAGILFVHGDQINRKDLKYLALKKLVKNSITKYILRYLPFGPGIAKSFKRGLKKTNKKFRIQIPLDEIKFFADNRFAEGIDTIFAGHFHQEYCYRSRESKKLYVLPDWLATQKITLYQKNPKKITTMHWRELL